MLHFVRRPASRAARLSIAVLGLALACTSALPVSAHARHSEARRSEAKPSHEVRRSADKKDVAQAKDAANDAPKPSAQGAAAAKDAYYKGDVARAYALATASGEHWIAGLSAFRMKTYDVAADQFAAVAHDRGSNEWLRSAANWWGARAAVAAGQTAKAADLLKAAARAPYTFYGLIAARQIGMQGSSAQASLKDSIDTTQFPTPDLDPKGGFTLDKALVYALVRQESRFNAAAANGVAFGLMQLTPATAARVAGDDKFAHDSSLLKDPRVNLRLGQDYVAKLIGAAKGDLVRAVASYNSGPGLLQKTQDRMGGAVDTMMLIESMPAAQTRDFVQKVMANYWIYRQMFGQTSATLDAAASGAKGILAALDK